MAGLSGGGVLVLNQKRMANFSKQDGYSIRQDEKCNQQALEIHKRMVSRWAGPQSGYRAVEGQRNIKHV